MFQSFRWRSPDEAVILGDFFACRGMSWLFICHIHRSFLAYLDLLKGIQLPQPYAFDFGRWNFGAAVSLPNALLLVENLTAYSSSPNQSYPLNVRVVPTLIAADDVCNERPYQDISHSKGHNLYQKVNINAYVSNNRSMQLKLQINRFFVRGSLNSFISLSSLCLTPVMDM